MSDEASYQDRVKPWLDACFGPKIATDKIERNHRFIEESLELVQTNGCTRSEAHQIVDYVFDRPAGNISQEVGGVMVTLAALCLAGGLDMHEQGEIELARVWTKVEVIRAKQAAKPKHSPLPEHVAAPAHPPLAPRWEGNDCYVGRLCLGLVMDMGDNWTHDRWHTRLFGHLRVVGCYSTREAARAAVEAAIRDRLGIGAPDTRVIDVETKR